MERMNMMLLTPHSPASRQGNIGIKPFSEAILLSLRFFANHPAGRWKISTYGDCRPETCQTWASLQPTHGGDKILEFQNDPLPDFHGREVSAIKKTRFAVRRQGDEFSFYVVDQVVSASGAP
jgi:hypothetical protein